MLSVHAFTRCGPNKKQAIVRLLLDPDNKLLVVPELPEAMQRVGSKCVKITHEFLRETCGMSVSLRDPSRLLKMWGFIRWEFSMRQQKKLAGGPLLIAKASLMEKQIQALFE